MLVPLTYLHCYLSSERRLACTRTCAQYNQPTRRHAYRLIQLGKASLDAGRKRLACIVKDTIKGARARCL